MAPLKFLMNQEVMEGARRKLELFSHLANVGDAKSLVIHPASTTHHRMDEKSLLESGIGPGLIRLRVGLEDVQDLIDDLKVGLRAVEKMVGKKS